MKRTLTLLLLISPVALATSVPQYPYGSVAFDQLIDDSFRQYASHPSSFESWLNQQYLKHPEVQPRDLQGQPVDQVLQARKTAWNAASPTKKVQIEKDLSQWAFHLIKVLIPRVGMDKGSELRNAAVTGERQCLLQGTLIAALLQKAGLPAGVVMVWQNPQGKISNLGHVTAWLKLSNGHSLLVDASDPEPFVEHQGIFATDLQAKALKFVHPIYTKQHEISSLVRVQDHQKLQVSDFAPLAYNYVRSQFYYYRGERVPGGFMGKSSSEGLQKSVEMLQKSIQYAPNNPLSVYVLGHVYRKQGKLQLATQQYQEGFKLYQQAGYVPEGPALAVKPKVKK